MLPKPRHLNSEYGDQFKDQTVVEAYPTRPPYPEETFSVLLSLITDMSRTVLELGCGTGDITRHLADQVDQIDAVDPSPAMLEKAQKLPNGAASNIRWIHSTAESFDYSSQYPLVIAAESLHWMQWDVVFPKIRSVLSRHGVLSIILGRGPLKLEWDDELSALIAQHSTNREYQPYDLLEELQLRGLFSLQQKLRTKPELFTQSVEDYINSFHSRNGFSKERMGSNAQEFDTKLKTLVEPYGVNGVLSFEVVAEIVWGLPTV